MKATVLRPKKPRRCGDVGQKRPEKDQEDDRDGIDDLYIRGRQSE